MILSGFPPVPPLLLHGGTVTASSPLIDASQTWNNAGVTFTGWKLNVTNTASAAASLLVDLQVGGTSKFSVRKGASVYITPAAYQAPSSGPLNIQVDGAGTGFVISNSAAEYTRFVSGGALKGLLGTGPVALVLRNGGNINLGPNSEDNYFFTPDVLEQRRGTNAQTFRIYNTYTDASNYERLNIFWSSNVAFIEPSNAGTGSARNLHIRGGGSLVLGSSGANRWQISSSTGHLLALTDNAHDIGASGATRPRDLYLARNVYLTGLPTADPTVAGQVWNDSGTLKVSAG